MNTDMQNPLWLVGTHRSGTTMLSAILEKMNCFMGWRKDRNNEATFFQRENDRLLTQSGGKWDNPSSFKWLVQCSDICQEQAVEARDRFLSLKGLEYWGIGRRARASSAVRGRWGWKDPRMSVTAPVWLKVYPDVTIVRVVRNGIDVAASLSKRENYFHKENKAKRPLSMRCLSLDGAFSLWAEYIECEETWLREHSRLPVFSCRYEDILEKPEDILRRLANFLGAEYHSELANGLFSARRYAFVEDPSLMKFYQSVRMHPMMVKHGYDSII